MIIYYDDLIELLENLPEVERGEDARSGSLTITFGTVAESTAENVDRYETSDGRTIVVKTGKTGSLVSLQITK